MAESQTSEISHVGLQIVDVLFKRGADVGGRQAGRRQIYYLPTETRKAPAPISPDARASHDSR